MASVALDGKAERVIYRDMDMKLEIEAVEKGVVYRGLHLTVYLFLMV